MKTNVLITSASRKVWLVKAFQKAIKHEGEGNVVAVDIDPFSAALYHSNVAYLVPKSSDNIFITTMLKLCNKEKIDIIVPTRDEELLLFAENRDKFEKKGTKIMVSNPDTIRICNDKLKFVKFCQKNKFSIPKTFTKDQIKQKKLNFPLFIRDRFGKGSKKAFKVENKNKLDYILKQIKNPIVQECYQGTEYTVDLFADFYGNIISVIPRKRNYVFCGESYISQTYKNYQIINDSIKLAKKLHLIGHNTIQCFFDNDKTIFIEVNPRYGGGAHLGFAAGANTPLYLIQLINNKDIKPKIGKFRDSLIMLRYTKDIFINEKVAKSVKKFD